MFTSLIFLLAFVFSSASIVDPVVPIVLPTQPKALVVSLPLGYSHVQFQCGLAQWLSEAGYEVHVLIAQFTSDKAYTCPMGTNVSRTFHFNAIGLVPDKLGGLQLGFKSFITSGFANEGAKDIIEVCKALFSDNSTMTTLQSENYDLGVAEFFNFCMFGALKKIGVKSMVVSSATAFQSRAAYEIGLPALSSFTPRVDELKTTNGEFTFLDRVWNLYVAAYEHLYSFADIRAYEDKILRNYFPDGSVTTSTIKKSWSLFVTNTNKFLDFSRLQTSKMIHIGGGMVKKPGKLSKSLQAVFAKPSKGVVYVSFGTIADNSRFPLIWQRSMRAVISHFKDYEFIWKNSGSTKDTIFASLPNVHFVNWVDQSAVLAHPKTVAFYTHCGLNSLNEASTFGVPLITTPVFGDQHYNAAVVQKRQLGAELLISDMSPSALIAAFKRVLENPLYRSNMQVLAQKMRKDPLPPKDTFIRWAKYLAEFHATEELDLDSADMSIFRFYSLDVIIPLFIVKGIIVAVGIRMITTAARILPRLQIFSQKSKIL